MTNTQTIEKLNEGLVQLIEAYEVLQNKNNNLEEEVAQLKAQKADLEYKLSDFSNNNDAQTTKMDGMLNKIQTLLKPSSKNIPIIEVVEDKEDIEENKVEENQSILDIKLDNDKDATKDIQIDSSNKIDLGRMESLLNGLNNK